MNAAAAANNGRQRAATHNSAGNSRAIGTTVVQGSHGIATATTLRMMSDASAQRPSIVSLDPGGSRPAEASPMTRGAVVTMPSASDANQFCQVSNTEVVAPCNKTNPRVPPIPEMAAATIAARQQPKHMPKPIQTKRRAEVALDQAGRQQGFPGIAQAEDD